MPNAKKPKTLLWVMDQYLRENGYDGLFNPTLGCGCFLEDLMSCGEPDIRCTAGKEIKTERKWFVGSEAEDE